MVLISEIAIERHLKADDGRFGRSVGPKGRGDVNTFIAFSFLVSFMFSKIRFLKCLVAQH